MLNKQLRHRNHGFGGNDKAENPCRYMIKLNVADEACTAHLPGMSLMEPCTLPFLGFNVVNSGHRTHCTVTAVFPQHPVSSVCWSNRWNGFPVYTGLMGEYKGSHSDWKTWKNGKAFPSRGKVREY